MEVREREGDDFFGGTQHYIDLYFLAPRALYEILEADDQWDQRADAISRAISAVIPPNLGRSGRRVPAPGDAQRPLKPRRQDEPPGRAARTSLGC